MCKRFIAIPLLCLVVFMAACPFYVSADSFPYPENTVYGSVNISFEAFSALSPISSVGAETVSFGSLWTGRFNNTSSTADAYGVTLDIKFVLNLQVGGDLYIAYPYYIDGGMDFTYYIPDLEEYRYPELDYNVDFGADWPVYIYTPNTDTNTFDKTFGKSSLYVKFIAYRNVPSGIYSGVITSNVNDDTLCFGVYASLGNQMNAMVDNFVASLGGYGSSSEELSTFLKELWDYRQSLNSESVEASMLHELEYQSSLEYLLSQVDVKYISFLQFFSQEVNGMLSALASGGIDYSTFISNVMGATGNASALCSTTEQYQCLINLSQNALSIAEGIVQQKVKAHLDQAISDEDMQKADEFHALESQLVQAFDHAELEAALQFDIWINQLPLEEVYEYRKFFDYLLTDSDIRYFIVVPLAMSLVSLLLGTRMRTKPDDADSGSSSWHTPHVSRLDREYYRTFHDYQK